MGGAESVVNFELGARGLYGAALVLIAMMARLWLLLLSLAGLLAVLRAQNDEYCPMYYGGLVFPDSGRRAVEHGLHWSKTQSR